MPRDIRFKSDLAPSVLAERLAAVVFEGDYDRFSGVPWEEECSGGEKWVLSTTNDTWLFVRGGGHFMWSDRYSVIARYERAMAALQAAGVDILKNG
mgnify:CR=1 FL=1